MTTWDLWLISEGGISCELQIVSKLDCFRGHSQYHRELYDSQWSVVRARESRRNTGNVSSFYRGHSLIPFQDRDTSIFLLYEWRNSLKNVEPLEMEKISFHKIRFSGTNLRKLYITHPWSQSWTTLWESTTHWQMKMMCYWLMSSTVFSFTKFACLKFSEFPVFQVNPLHTQKLFQNLTCFRI